MIKKKSNTKKIWFLCFTINEYAGFPLGILTVDFAFSHKDLEKVDIDEAMSSVCVCVCVCLSAVYHQPYLRNQ